MTVKQLIKELSKMPPYLDIKVCTDGAGEQYSDILEVVIDEEAVEDAGVVRIGRTVVIYSEDDL